MKQPSRAGSTNFVVFLGNMHICTCLSESAKKYRSWWCLYPCTKCSVGFLFLLRYQDTTVIPGSSIGWVVKIVAGTEQHGIVFYPSPKHTQTSGWWRCSPNGFMMLKRDISLPLVGSDCSIVLNLHCWYHLRCHFHELYLHISMIVWLVVLTILKNMFVSWDDYSQSMENHKSHVPNHQPVVIYG